VTDTAGSSGLFGRFAPFDERSAEAFVGRAADTERLVALVTGEPRSVIVTGPTGVGKTSLLRAGMAPALGRRGLGVVTLGSYGDIERELVRATSLSGITPPVPGQDPADYLGFVSRESKQGMVLVLDHLEEVLGEGSAAAADVVALLRRVREEGGPRLRLVLSIEESAFSRVEGVFAALGGRPEPRITLTVPPFDEATVTDILEKSAVQSGTPFEAGLPSTVAGDLCKDGPCRGIDLQLVVRAIIDLRLASTRRYRKSGGPTVLPPLWMAHVCRAAGGAIARRALLAACEVEGVTSAELGGTSMIRRGGSRDRGPEVLESLRARGLLQTSARGRTEVFTLAHPALREPVREFAIADRARAVVARRALHRRNTP
jgi:hypothetical protein